MRSINIIRLRQDDTVQTLGHGIVFDGIEKIYEFKTLELPWLDNQKNISCIPKGEYTVAKYQSPTHGRGIVFQFDHVEGRSNVQIHKGNYYDDILGCVLVGAGFTDINQDGYLDVHSSGNTMNKLLEIMPETFIVTIS